MKGNGLRYIKPGSTPIPTNTVVNQSEDFTSSSSDSSVFKTPPRKAIGFHNTPSEATVISPASTVSSLEGVPFKEKNEQGGEEIQSSITDIASEAENEILKLSNIGLSARYKEVPSKAVSKKRKIYVGDMSSSNFSSPKKRKRNLEIVKRTVVKQRKRIHSLQMSVRRLKLRISSLESLLKYLKEKSLISESSESTIRATVSGPAADIFEKLLKGPSTQKYDPSLRCFALTLSFYSAKAYEFVRNTFNRTLLHLGTISKWYRSVDGSPGFTKEALLALILKQKMSSKPIVCNLVMDEMSIRCQVEWTGNKFTGYIDICTNIDKDALPEATEVLVFMAVVEWFICKCQGGFGEKMPHIYRRKWNNNNVFNL